MFLTQFSCIIKELECITNGIEIIWCKHSLCHFIILLYIITQIQSYLIFIKRFPLFKILQIIFNIKEVILKHDLFYSLLIRDYIVSCSRWLINYKHILKSIKRQNGLSFSRLYLSFISLIFFWFFTSIAFRIKLLVN